MVKRMVWGLCAVIVVAGLFTVTELGLTLAKAPREPGCSAGVDFISFARNYLFNALTIGVLIFGATFSIVSFAKRK